MTDRYASAFHDIIGRLRATTIIHGDSRGADREFGRLARARGLTVIAFPADWKKYGVAAGPIRNAQMIEEGRPDLVLAAPGGRGTTDMVRQAKAAEIKVIELRP